jgi:branched-subunit amino acid ABC-type transport system permease component
VALAVQIVISGIAAGALYGVVAVSFSLVYRLTGVIHFALGELISITVLIAVLLAAGVGPVTQTNVDPLRFISSVLAAIVACGLIGGVIYVGGVRPFLARGQVLGWIGTLVAAAFMLRALVEVGFAREGVVFPDVFAFEGLGHGGVIVLGGGVTVEYRSFYVMAAGRLLSYFSYLFLDRTSSGRALRAVADDREGALLLGIPVERLLVVAFVLAGALAGVAAIVAAPGGAVTADTGSLLGLKGLAAAVLGRFVLPWRVVFAGLLLGLVESIVVSADWGPVHLGPTWGVLIPLLLAVLFVAAARPGARARTIG